MKKEIMYVIYGLSLVFGFSSLHAEEKCHITFDNYMYLIQEANTQLFVGKLPCSHKEKILEILHQSRGTIVWKNYLPELEITPPQTEILSLEEKLQTLFQLEKEEKILDIQFSQFFPFLFAKNSAEEIQIQKLHSREFILEYQQKRYTGRVKIGKAQDVYVLKKDVELGETVQLDFLEKKKIFLEKPLGPYPPTFSVNSFYQYNKKIQRESVLDPRDIMPRILIRPGDKVKVQLKYKGIRVESYALAREMGKIDQDIRLSNLKSQQEFYAKVMGEKMAMVQVGGDR